MKKKGFILFVACLISACAATYKLPDNVKTSQLTVRSLQGQGVRASIFKLPETCSEREVLKSNVGNKSSKTYTLPSSELVLGISMLPGSVNSYSCNVTLKLNAVEGQHYVIDLIADKGKQRCNNRIFNFQDKTENVNAQYIDAVFSGLLTSKAKICDESRYVEITSSEGRFTSTAYINQAFSTGVPGVIGTTNSAIKEK